MAKDRKTTQDQAGVGPDPRATRHLTPLSELPKVKVASDDPDIRGWPVFTSSGREIGTVDDLLVDTTLGEVVMLDIDVTATNRRTLAPIRAAWVDRDNRRVILDSAELAAGSEPPTLGREAHTREELERFGERYREAYGDDMSDRDLEESIRSADEARSREVRERAAPPPPAEPTAADLPVQRRAAPDERPGKVIEEVVVRRRVVPADEVPPASPRDPES